MECKMCGGKGVIYCVTCRKGNVSPPWLSGEAEGKCSVCESGKQTKCPVCEGTGKV